MTEPRTSRGFFGTTIEGAFRHFLRRTPKQARSRSLVEAVLVAFDEQVTGADPEEVTIESLSDRAGVGIGSFYEYFSGKDSLLGAFIGRVTRENFTKLSQTLDSHQHHTLDDLVRAFSKNVALEYMAHPRRMRVLVDGISRLGLLHAVNLERDRFAEVMADKARVYLPRANDEALTRTMQIIADATMGILVSCTSRDSSTHTKELANEISVVAIAILHQRHGAAAAEPIRLDS
jgi:AcrR family transcriptional regulator